MILRTLLGATALCVVTAASAGAQALPDWRGNPTLVTIANAESGMKNIPNYRYDKTHTAGGNLQITDTNWRLYAPQLGIDIDKYPNALSAPEHEQGQVGGLMLAREGVNPWTCCNEKLRKIFGDGASAQPVKKANNQSAPSKAPEPKAADAPKSPHCWDVFAKECASRKWDVFAKN